MKSLLLSDAAGWTASRFRPSVETASRCSAPKGPATWLVRRGGVSYPFVYLLYLDESGTHGGSPALILGGLAIHEHDAYHFQQKLEGVLARKLPKGLKPKDFELHAAEIKTPVKKKKGVTVTSPWAQVPMGTRLDILKAVYSAIGSYSCFDQTRPCALFGAVIDNSYADREQRAYEEVLHKFDDMLEWQYRATGVRERGIVIHDKRSIERDVQGWANTWRRVSGRIGKLSNFTDAPFFSDSRASRMIQAADFVSWALWRYYGCQDDSRIKGLWNLFDSNQGVMHGLIHVVPGFHQGACTCPPCSSRLNKAAAAP